MSEEQKDLKTYPAEHNESQPPKRYRFAVTYYVADPFGEIIYKGVATMSQLDPIPTAASSFLQTARFEASTARTIRSIPEVPEGRILIAAVVPLPE